MNSLNVLLFALFFYSLNAFSQDQILVEGELDEDLDMSAIACDGHLCLLASDETNHLQVAYYHNKSLKVLDNKIELGTYKKENDIEALSFDGDYFYAIGSHGLSRKSGKHQPSRYHLFRIKITGKGELIDLKKTSLNKFIQNNKVLKKYFKKRLQDNGINIEGLGVSDGKIYVGYRAPIINQNAIIQIIDLDKLFGDDNHIKDELKYFNLNGRGIRSLEFKNNSYYIIAGNSAPYDDNNSELYIFNHQAQQLNVPFANLKLEGMELIKNGYIYIYDSESMGLPTFQSNLFFYGAGHPLKAE